MFNINPYSYNALPVRSMKEAQNAPNDFSGNPVFYFNSAENEIYLKRFDMSSGKILFGKYIFSPIEPEKKPEDELKTINDKLDYLYKIIEQKNTKSKKEEPKKEVASDD